MCETKQEKMGKITIGDWHECKRGLIASKEIEIGSSSFKELDKLIKGNHTIREIGKFIVDKANELCVNYIDIPEYAILEEMYDLSDLHIFDFNRLDSYGEQNFELEYFWRFSIV